jgi:hypothetical protein
VELGAALPASWSQLRKCGATATIDEKNGSEPQVAVRLTDFSGSTAMIGPALLRAVGRAQPALDGALPQGPPGILTVLSGGGFV